MGNYSFVTVAHEPDFPFLLLQAQSLALYLPPALASEILVIDNGLAGRSIRKLRTAYGSLSPKVKVISAASVPMPRWLGGWHRQQVLKLWAASRVRSARYLVLDAKNHLVFPLERAFLERNGKLRTRWINYRHLTTEGGVRKRFLDRLECAARYFETKIDERKFPPSTTPNILIAEEVRQLTKHVGGNFAQDFYRIGATEFMLYNAWLSSRGRLGRLYDFSGKACPEVWESTQEANLSRVISSADSSRPFFSVHRRAWAKMSPQGRSLVRGFWRERGLELAV